MLAELLAVPRALRLSRRNLRTIRQNLGWAFGYDLAALPLAALGLLHPVIAGAAMGISSVSVVANASGSGGSVDPSHPPPGRPDRHGGSPGGHDHPAVLPHPLVRLRAKEIGDALRALPGVWKIVVEVFNRRILVTYGPPTGLDDVLAALDAAGYPCAAVLTAARAGPGPPTRGGTSGPDSERANNYDPA